MTQVGRELNARYVIEGSVRRANDRVRITAQLVDAATAIISGRRLTIVGWATYLSCRTRSRAPSSARSSLSSFVPSSSGRSASGPKVSMRGISPYARFPSARREKQDLAAAERLLAEAASWIPTASYAHSLIALCRFIDALGRWTGTRPRAGPDLLAARQAVALDDADWLAHALLGIALLWTQRQHDRAIEEQEKALALNPSGSLSHQFAGCVRGFRASPRRPSCISRPCLQLDPRLSDAGQRAVRPGARLLFLDEPEEALDCFDRALVEQPDYVRGWQRKAACLGHVGARRKRLRRSPACSSCSQISRSPMWRRPIRSATRCMHKPSARASGAPDGSDKRLPPPGPWSFLRSCPKSTG